MASRPLASQDWLEEIRRPFPSVLLGQDKKKRWLYQAAFLITSTTYRSLIKSVCRQYQSDANPLIDLRLGQIVDFQWHFLRIMQSLYDP